MKRLLGMLLCVCLLLSCVPALAEDGGHVSFTINSTHSNATMDYDKDGLYDYISQKFDFDYEVWPVSKDSQAEKFRIWVNGGTMPDCVTLRDFKYQEYATYAEQGLLAPLPTGWEETYPNLYKMVVDSGMYDKMQLDGQMYAIPHAIFSNFAHMDTVVNHLSVYYRKDWVEQLGLEPFGTVITLSQLADYLQKAIDADLAGNGNTIGLSDNNDYAARFFTLFSDVSYNTFMRIDGKYVWGAAQPGVINALKLASQWYHEGLLDPDFYLMASADAVNKFTSGIAAAMYHNCAISSYEGYRVSFQEATGLDPAECIGAAAIADDNGVVHAIETANYWSATFFSPDIDPVVMDRILQMMDWMCTTEGELTVMMGVPGETWEQEADGSVKLLVEADAEGKIPSTAELYNSFSVFRSLGILADDYSFINPTNDAQVISEVKDIYAAKQLGTIIPLDFDYETFASDAKANYSLKLEDEFSRVLIMPEDEVEAAWDTMVDTNKSIWQPVVDDLNAAFCQ